MTDYNLWCYYCWFYSRYYYYKPSTCFFCATQKNLCVHLNLIWLIHYFIWDSAVLVYAYDWTFGHVPWFLTCARINITYIHNSLNRDAKKKSHRDWYTLLFVSWRSRLYYCVVDIIVVKSTNISSSSRSNDLWMNKTDVRVRVCMWFRHHRKIFIITVAVNAATAIIIAIIDTYLCVCAKRIVVIQSFSIDEFTFQSIAFAFMLAHTHSFALLNCMPFTFI